MTKLQDALIARQKAAAKAAALKKKVVKSTVSVTPKTVIKAKKKSVKKRSRLTKKKTTSTKSSVVPTVIQDVASGITPVGRQLIDQAPITVSKEGDKGFIGPVQQTVDTTSARRDRLEGTQEFSSVVDSKPITVPQVIKDVSQDVTPIERVFIEQAPTPVEVTSPKVDTTTVSRRERIIGTQEFSSIPELEPEPEPTYKSGQQIKQQSMIDLAKRTQPYKDIDPTLQYDVDGTIVSGTELQDIYKRQIKEDALQTIRGLGRVKSGLYIEEDGQNIKIPDTMQKMDSSVHQKYVRAVSDYQKGNINEEQVQKLVGEIQQTGLSKMSDTRHLDWMKEHGTFADESGESVPWSNLEEQGYRMRIVDGKADIYAPSEYELGKEAYDTLVSQYMKAAGGDKARAKQLVDIKLGSVALMSSPLAMDTVLESAEIRGKQAFLDEYEEGLKSGEWNTPHQFAIWKERQTQPGPVVGAIQNLLGQSPTKSEKVKAIEATLKDYMYVNKPSQQSTLYSLAMKDLGYSSALHEGAGEFAKKVVTEGAMVEGVIIPTITLGVGAAIGGATSAFGGRIAGALGRTVTKVTPTASKVISKLGPKASTIITKSIHTLPKIGKVISKPAGYTMLGGFGAMSVADVYTGAMPRTEMFTTPEGQIYSGERGGVRGGAQRAFAQTMMWGGMLTGAKIGAKYGSKYRDLTTLPSDMPKDVSGFRRLSPEKAKSAFRKSSLKLHPDKPGGSAEAFRPMQEAYKSYGKDPRITRMQDIRSVLSGRNIYVRPEAWHRFTPETPVGLLTIGKTPIQPKPQIKVQPGVQLKPGGSELVFSSRTLGKPLTFYRQPIPESLHWWGGLESDMGFRYPRPELKVGLVQGKAKQQTLGEWGLREDILTLRKTSSGIPEVSYGPKEPYRIVSKESTLRAPTFEETQAHLSKMKWPELTKGKMHTERTQLEEWGVFDTVGKSKMIRPSQWRPKHSRGKITTRAELRGFKGGRGKVDRLSFLKEQKASAQDKKDFLQRRKKAYEEWKELPESGKLTGKPEVVEYGRMGEHEYTILEPGREKFKYTKLAERLKERQRGVHRKGYLKDVPDSVKPKETVSVIKAPKDGVIYIDEKTGKAVLHKKGKWYKESMSSEGKLTWKEVKTEPVIDTPSVKKPTKIPKSKFSVVRTPRGGKVYIDKDTGKAVLYKDGKWFREGKISKEGLVSWEEAKSPYAKKVTRRYDIERRVKQDYLQYQKPKTKKPEPWISSEQVRGSVKQVKKSRVEPELGKRKIKKKKVIGDEYTQEYEPEYHATSGEAGVALGPGSPFGKMSVRKSGWGGISLRDLEALDTGGYTSVVHKHWKDVAPHFGKSITPSIYQGGKGKISPYSRVKKLPAYQIALGIGVGIRTIPDYISGSIPIDKSVVGELPKEKDISKEIQDTFYGVTPVYRQDTIPDTIPVQREDVIQDVILDSGYTHPPQLEPPGFEPYYDTPEYKPPKPKPPVVDLPEDDLLKKKLPIKMFRKEKHRTGYKEKTYDVKDMWAVTKFKKPKFFSLAKKR